MLTKEAILEYLALPQRPSPKEMKEQVKAYLASLTTEEKEALTAEEGSKAEYASEVEFLRQAGFTSLEAGWYAGVGLDVLEIRRLVARRALTLRLSEKPLTTTAYQLIELEERTLKGMTDEQVLEELRK